VGGPIVHKVPGGRAQGSQATGDELRHIARWAGGTGGI